MPDEPRTWDDKYTMAEWWAKAEEVQRSRQKSKLFAPLISQGDLVFDIGANRGILTVVFRWLGAQVIAVDPLFAIGPKYVAEFDWKFGNDSMVTKVPNAISYNQTAVIWVHKNLPYLSSGSSPWMRKSAHAKMYHKVNTKPMRVKAVKLDDLVDQFGVPRFVKVDVEGAENSVISTLSHPVGAMSMEFHEDWIPTNAMKHMGSKADYEWNYALGMGGQYVFDRWVKAHDLLLYLDKTLTKKGPLSWGDIYCRRRDMIWN